MAKVRLSVPEWILSPKQWDAGKGIAIGKSNETIAINKQIETFKSELEQHYRNMVENQGFITAELLKNALRGIGTVQNCWQRRIVIITNKSM